MCQGPDLDDVREVNVGIKHVLLACRNLLVVDPQQDTWGSSHLSVQEYFESRVWRHERRSRAGWRKLVLKLLIATPSTPSTSPVEPTKI